MFSHVPAASRKSSIFLRREVGVVFMRVNSKCAHQVRPPLAKTLQPLVSENARHSCRKAFIGSMREARLAGK